MSRHQKIPHWKQEQHCAHSETQGLEAAQVSQALEEISLSSHRPVPGNLEALATGTPCSPQSPQKAISSCKLDKSNDSQEREASSASSKYRPDTENLPLGTLDEKVTLLVQFLLHKYQMNEPITKADMIDVVIKEYRSDFPEIFKRASEHMELVFGIDVEEVDTSSHSYVLVNKLGLTYDPRLSGDGTMPKTSLLIIVLGVIFMKGNCATEEEIWEVLNMMGLYSGRNHFIFGEPRKFITKDLVQEKYLEYQQVPNSHPPRYEFLWGPRAHAETSKMKLLEFLTKIHQSDPKWFSSQYQEALRDEAERAQARTTARASTTAKARASSSAKSGSYPHP